MCYTGKCRCEDHWGNCTLSSVAPDNIPADALCAQEFPDEPQDDDNDDIIMDWGPVDDIDW